MDIQTLPDVINLKSARDRLESIVWRCRNIGDGRILVLLPALNVTLPDGSVASLPEEVVDIVPNVQEREILKHAEEQALADIKEIDKALIELGVKVKVGEIYLNAPTVAAVAERPADSGEPAPAPAA